jgi:hypothetical protein
MGHLNLGNILFRLHHIRGTFKFKEFGAAAPNLLSSPLLIKLLNIIHIKTYITPKISTLILNFKQALCESRMNFLSTTNRLLVPPGHKQRVYLWLRKLIELRHNPISPTSTFQFYLEN